MIHPAVAEEALNQIVMAIYDLGMGLGEVAVLPPEPDQTDRLRLLGKAAEDIVLLVNAGHAVIRNITKDAPPAL